MFLAGDFNNHTPLPTLTLDSCPSLSPVGSFPPEEAFLTNLSVYIHIGCLAILLWDIVDNGKLDICILFRRSIKLPTVIYIITRLSLLGYMGTRAVLLTQPISECSGMYDAINTLLIFSISATTAMFYLRVCAVYEMSRAVIISFGLLWLGLVGILLTLPVTFTATRAGATSYCVEVIHGPFLGPILITLTIYDTLVYIAIAYRIFAMFSSSNASPRAKFLTLLTFGKSLPVVSRALLKDSQLYFLVVMVTNPFIVSCVYVFKPPISVMFLVCHLVLVNILSCRVYRNIKMGLEPEVPLSALRFSAEEEPGAHTKSANVSRVLE